MVEDKDVEDKDKAEEWAVKNNAPDPKAEGYNPHTETHFNLRGNSVIFLESMLEQRKSRHWRKIAFEHDDLAWIAKVWDAAAIAAAGDTRVRDACRAEAVRYRGLANELWNGMKERQQDGLMFLDSPSDWPHSKVLKSAIAALRHADIGRLH